MIHVDDLVKTYRVPIRPPGVGAAVRALFRRRHRLVTAVDHVSFEIAEGERVGFLGPNGAGKTTTIKVLAGLLHPTAGEVRVAGFEPRRRERDFLSSIMMVAGQKQQLLWDLPPSETLELNRAIYGVSRERFRQTLDELVALLELEPLLEKPTRQLSLGERMRCELAAALLHEPRVLFLDEPTIGLDVTAQAALRAFVRRYNESRGATVLLTSHYMDDVAALCPRVLVIDQGRLTYDGSLSALARALRPDRRVTLRLGEGVERSLVEELGARVVSWEADLVVLQVSAESLRPVIARALGALPVLDLAVEEAPLEEVIADLFASSRAGRERAVATPAGAAP
ncbi:MAG TPA: ATP-binding cassette domain-containing protein [Thermoanaerobaculia bacterium]|nr:ATP-binding cassette domain-containing protein [Thermoanaerobaculia bacterium]